MYQYIPTDINNFSDKEQEHFNDCYPEFSGFHGFYCPYAIQNGTTMYRNLNSEHENDMINESHGNSKHDNDMMMHPHQKLLSTIQHCEEVCEHMTHMLKHKHDIHMRIEQLTLLQACADICTLMAKYLARMSEFSKGLAKICAKICETCGKECDKFEDHHSQHCAKVCLHCGEECEDFAD